MTSSQNKTHQHKFTKLVLKRITKISNKHYKGTAGDRAFIVGQCECDKFRALDYGLYKDMLKKYEVLTVNVEKS